MILTESLLPFLFANINQERKLETRQQQTVLFQDNYSVRHIQFFHFRFDTRHHYTPHILHTAHQEMNQQKRFWHIESIK